MTHGGSSSSLLCLMMATNCSRPLATYCSTYKKRSNSSKPAPIHSPLTCILTFTNSQMESFTLITPVQQWPSPTVWPCGLLITTRRPLLSGSPPQTGMPSCSKQGRRWALHTVRVCAGRLLAGDPELQQRCFDSTWLGLLVFLSHIFRNTVQSKHTR